jgi:hypothetical protein
MTEVFTLKTVASVFAGNFATAFSNIQALDFSSSPSKLFTLRPNLQNRSMPILSLATPFVANELGMAMSSQASVEQHTMFAIFSNHPSLRSSA